MYRGKVCGLFALSLIVSSIVLSVLSSGVSYAASAYDNAYQTVNTLQLWNGTSNIDVSTSWAGYFTDSQNYPNAWNGYAHVKEQFMTSWQNRQRWSVVQQCNGTSEQCYYIVYWSENADFYLEWSSDPLMVTGHSSTWVNALKVEWNSSANDFRVSPYQEFNGKRNGLISYPAANVKNFITYTDFPNYPVDYAGGEIVMEVADPKKKLQFGWSVDTDGTVTGTFTQNVKSDMLAHCGITWTLYQSDNTWTTGSTINTATQDQFMSYVYKSITPGFYQLEAKPNVCIPFIDDGSIASSKVDIAYNGAFISGVSDKGGNSKTPLAEQSALINSFGFTQAIQAPLKAISRMVGARCAPITLPLFNGSSMTLPCLSGFYSSTLPVFFGIWQVVITGIIMYWFAINMLAHIKRLMNPNNDSIEAVDL